MSGWELGIDFGTSNTVAAIATTDGVTVLDLETNGQSRMPSSVFLTEDGTILVGTAAQHQSVFAPERFEATPKRSLSDGEIFLGDEFMPVTDLVAGVLRKVFAEACLQRGETLPDVVRLTHPAEWGQPRIDLLATAARRAGLPSVQFIAEPVAAALWIASSATRPGQRIAVYDYGGGTFDAAVLERTEAGFEVCGPPAGRDPLGGEDIDRKIIDYIGRVAGETAPQDWAKLIDPPDVSWRRCAAALRMEVRRAKETLSEVNTCQLWIPGLERELQLTRAELDELIGSDVDRCTDTLLAAMSDAGATPEQLAGLYLVGGSSRIPLVAERLWHRLNVKPQVQDSPKSVVALGAARGFATRPRAIAGPAPQAVDERTVVTARDVQAEVLVDRSSRAGRPVTVPAFLLPAAADLPGLAQRASIQLRMDRGTTTIRLREEPCADATANDLAQRIGAFRAARSRGYRELSRAPAAVLGMAGVERVFTMTSSNQDVTMVERYLVGQGRCIVLAFPAEVHEVAAAIGFVETAVPPGSVASPVLLPRLDGWHSSEQLLVAGPDGSPWLSAERGRLPSEPVEAWRWHRLEALMRTLPGAAVAQRTGGRVLGALPGDIVTVRWSGSHGPMVTKLGTASASGEGFVQQVSVPYAEHAGIPRLAELITLHPAAVAAR
jgi:actin-like ATPase involved in cell morphogenesis